MPAIRQCGRSVLGVLTGQVKGDYGAAAAKKDLGAAIPYLAEGAGNQDGIPHIGAHSTTLVAAVINGHLRTVK